MTSTAAFRYLGYAVAILCNVTVGHASEDGEPQLRLNRRIVCPSFQEAGIDLAEIERQCLPRFDGIAVRDGDALRVTLRDGSTRSFKNSPEACRDANGPAACVFYFVKGLYPENDAVVVERRMAYAPTEFLLGAYMVERATGRVIDLPNEPRFSPDGSRFASLSACADYCADRIDIWSIHDGAAKLEWRMRIKQKAEQTYFYQFVAWQGSDRVKLRIFPERPTEGDAGSEVIEAEAVDAGLRRSGQGWSLEAPLPP